MDIDAIAAHESTSPENAAHTISTSEVRPDSMVIAWTHYVIVVDN